MSTSAILHLLHVRLSNFGCHKIKKNQSSNIIWNKTWRLLNRFNFCEKTHRNVWEVNKNLHIDRKTCTRSSLVDSSEQNVIEFQFYIEINNFPGNNSKRYLMRWIIHNALSEVNADTIRKLQYRITPQFPALFPAVDIRSNNANGNTTFPKKQSGHCWRTYIAGTAAIWLKFFRIQTDETDTVFPGKSRREISLSSRPAELLFMYAFIRERIKATPFSIYCQSERCVINWLHVFISSKVLCNRWSFLFIRMRKAVKKLRISFLSVCRSLGYTFGRRDRRLKFRSWEWKLFKHGRGLFFKENNSN